MLESKAAVQADFELKSWADRKSRWFSRFKQDSWLRDSITLRVTVWRTADYMAALGIPVVLSELQKSLTT